MDVEKGLWPDRQDECRFHAPAVRERALTVMSDVNMRLGGTTVAPLRTLIASFVCDILKRVSFAGHCHPPQVTPVAVSRPTSLPWAVEERVGM